MVQRRKSAKDNETPVWIFPSLLTCESEEHFWKLRDAIWKDLHPSGAIEEMFTYDLVVLIYEILRYRTFLHAIVSNELELEAIEYHERYGAEDKQDDRAELDKASNVERVQAAAMITTLDKVQMMERLIASTESRRNRMLSNLMGYRSSFGTRARVGTDRILNDNQPSTASFEEQSAAPADKKLTYGKRKATGGKS